MYGAFRRVLLLAAFVVFLSSLLLSAAEMDAETGLIIADGFETVKEHCTLCHSARMIIQNRMDRNSWEETIRWMQETQGLRTFDRETERVILDYLAANYAPAKALRRPPLDVTWE